ncbi:uncharacterized protein EI90DRAFT_3067050 [Cantharellus anzutake]|uniref:uncharacterized protein n=1 Tax=Cantharellus anzutake TaxID=1750568 RepID=UPI00190675C2|nr:uncharacterized protein EI90DRAFT_3067050 [Cantharellus anzutake]KAF8327798.1 hypothetical protein EI90DRAFT_3067050 [Cantharellus anzutake]
MSLYLRRMRTGFPRTDSVVRFLTIYAVNTGLLTSLAAMAIMFAFAFYGFHFVHECFILPLGGLYTASLLANLHSRSTIRERLHRGNSVGESIHLSRLPDKVREDISRVVQGTRGGISNPESNQTASTHPRV